MSDGRGLRILFAGGGTGGHLFPALAVAGKVKEKAVDAKLLFIGTKGKIESRVVPKLGYDFKTIPISGMPRKLSFAMLLFPFKVLFSFFKALGIAMKFKPDVAVGSGGYVAGPAVYAASVMGAKIILLEQNSYPGITTRLLEKSADELHIAYEDAKKYLRKKDGIFVTGNPVRFSIDNSSREEALTTFSLQSEKKTLLVLGGSLGARAVNEALADALPKCTEADIQIIWQTGKHYYDEFKQFNGGQVIVKDFLDDMGAAYTAADLVVSRAGATTIAELAALGKPAVLVPSPHVAENHQYYNAKSLVDMGAVQLLTDGELKEKICSTVITIITNDIQLQELSENIKKFSKPNAADEIAWRVIHLAAGTSPDGGYA